MSAVRDVFTKEKQDKLNGREGLVYVYFYVRRYYSDVFVVIRESVLNKGLKRKGVAVGVKIFASLLRRKGRKN